MVSMIGISVFAIFFFFYGTAVLGSPQCPLPYSKTLIDRG